MTDQKVTDLFFDKFICITEFSKFEAAVKAVAVGAIERTSYSLLLQHVPPYNFNQENVSQTIKNFLLEKIVENTCFQNRFPQNKYPVKLQVDVRQAYGCVAINCWLTL